MYSYLFSKRQTQDQWHIFGRINNCLRHVDLQFCRTCNVHVALDHQSLPITSCKRERCDVDSDSIVPLGDLFFLSCCSLGNTLSFFSLFLSVESAHFFLPFLDSDTFFLFAFASPLENLEENHEVILTSHRGQPYRRSCYAATTLTNVPSRFSARRPPHQHCLTFERHARPLERVF